MRRRLLLAALVAASTLLFSAVAFGYYTIIVGKGSGSAILGADMSGTLALHASFANGLAPGGSEPITITADNPSDAPGRVDALTATVTDSASGCNPSWFTVSGLTLAQPVAVPAGSTGVQVATGTLTFTDSGTDQSACESSTLTVNLTSGPSGHAGPTPPPPGQSHERRPHHVSTTHALLILTPGGDPQRRHRSGGPRPPAKHSTNALGGARRRL